MKYTLLFSLILLVVLSCKKQDDVPVNDIIYNLNLSSHTGLADGGTPVVVTVNLSKDADVSKRSVFFTISSGNFVNGLNGSIIVPATVRGDSIIATATFISPSVSKSIIIRAMPNIPDSNKYTLSDSVSFAPSLPASISLQSSSYGLRYNYQSEDTISGTIRNNLGRGVSSGVKVLFEDSLVASPSSARGNYKPQNTTVSSDGNSKVGTIYSNGVQPPGTNILIRATVLNGTIKTDITDYIILKTTN